MTLRLTQTTWMLIATACFTAAADPKYTLSCTAGEVIIGRRLENSIEPGYRVLDAPDGAISSFDLPVSEDKEIVFGPVFSLPGEGNVRGFVSPGLDARVSPSPGRVSLDAPLTRSVLFGLEKVVPGDDAPKPHPYVPETRPRVLAAREWLLNAGNLGSHLVFSGRYGLFGLSCSVKDP